MSVLLSAAILTVTPGAVLAVDPRGVIEQPQIVIEIKRHFGRATEQPKPTSRIHLYSIRYWSSDDGNTPVVISGVIALPDTKLAKGLVLFCHGTTADRRNVPSEMTPGNAASIDTRLAALTFTTAGYAVIAPDYLGLGVHDGIHPYAQRINSKAGRDLIIAARNFAGSKGLDFANKLYVTGYSEGGGIAMWSARELWSEANPRLHPNAAAPLSGPYDLSATMANTMLKRARTPVETALRLYFMSYFAMGLPQSKHIPLSDLFVPSYASYVPRAFELGGTDSDIGKRLANKALQVGGLLGIERVVQGSARKAIREQDANSPIIRVLREHDSHAWEPTGPLYLVGLRHDGVVPFDNTRIAMLSMRKLGVDDRRVNFHAITTREMDHMQAAAPALILAKKFFEGGFKAVPTDPDP